jgi:hypothetical protein
MRLTSAPSAMATRLHARFTAPCQKMLLNGKLSSPVDNYFWKHAVESLRLRLITLIWCLGTLHDDYAGQ